MADFKSVVETAGLVVDGAGVLVIAAGMVLATVRFVIPGLRRDPTPGRDAYKRYRQDLGRAILLGLEFLVAGDIIRTVAVAPTIQNVLVLAMIVVIRTFLSMSLEVELEGRWPWRARKAAVPNAGA